LIVSQSFTPEMLQALPEDLRRFYEIDALFVAVGTNDYWWAIRHGARWYLGDTVGDLFVDLWQGAYDAIMWQPSDGWIV
jgi:lysophospholipase L1-like esterase